MTRKLVVPGLVVALCGAGALAAIGIADEDESAFQAPALNDEFGSAGADTLHRVDKPSAGAAAASATAAKKRKKVKIQYFEVEPFTIDVNEGLGDSLTCPGKRRVLSGYFAAESIDVAETFSAPEGPKTWFEGITNFGVVDNMSAPALIGIVCAKGVK
jgi:hypothetical protein